MSPVLSTCQHRTDRQTLLDIVDKFQEWRRTAEDKKWPQLVYGPKALGSDLGHTVIMILEGTALQIANLTWHFYGLLDMRHDSLYEPMATTRAELDDPIKSED
jgi:hypothetical protein